MIKNLLYIAILTTVTIFSWIGFSVYHSYTTSTIDESTKIIITPILAEFDQETIEKIKLKRVINPNLSEERIIASPVPIATSEATASPSGQEEL